MSDIKLRGKCKGCFKKKWFIRKRKIKTPVGEATSQDLYCGDCYKLLKNMNK